MWFLSSLPSGDFFISGSYVMKTIVPIFPMSLVTLDFYCIHSSVASAYRLKSQTLVYFTGCSPPHLCLCLLPIPGSFLVSCSAFEWGEGSYLLLRSRCRHTMDVHTGVGMLQFCSF